MFRPIAAMTLGVMTLTACGAPAVAPSNRTTVQATSAVGTFSGSVAPPNAPSGPAVDAFARNFLDSIQAQSIRDRAEYCGYFFVDAAGRLQATPPIRGRLAACDMPAPQPGQGIFASYHTHGSYDFGYDNEVPSTIDLLSDFQFGIDGYVSTPGGRVWLVDYQTRSTSQVCGLRCVTSDSAFPAVEPGKPVQQSYTVESLRVRYSLSG